MINYYIWLRLNLSWFGEPHT